MPGDESWAVRGGTVLTPLSRIAHGVVAGTGATIRYVGPLEDQEGDELLRRSSAVYDAAGCIVVPGFVDVHVHGGGGGDVMAASEEALARMAAAHARHGTTSFLATTWTAGRDTLLAVARTVARLVGVPLPGATCAGLHLEGPFLNPRQAGAQNPAHLRPADLDELAALWDVLGPAFRLITLAPEMPGALRAAQWLREHGVTVSLGHTDATYEQARAGFGAGITHATHTFNGMRGLHHREPGAAGAILAAPDLMAEVIADGVHVHPAAMQVLYRSRGADGVALVTDAVHVLGLPDGEYDMAGQRARLEGDRIRLTEGGNLAGSVLTMARAVANMVRLVGVPVDEAVRMATLNPARSAGLTRKGILEPGKDADLVVLGPDLEVRLTMALGRVVHRA